MWSVIALVSRMSGLPRDKMDVNGNVCVLRISRDSYNSSRGFDP